ncbi:hypothetical protein FOZ62_025678, partial [Perkinsus olseni]
LIIGITVAALLAGYRVRGLSLGAALQQEPFALQTGSSLKGSACKEPPPEVGLATWEWQSFDGEKAAVYTCEPGTLTPDNKKTFIAKCLALGAYVGLSRCERRGCTDVPASIPNGELAGNDHASAFIDLQSHGKRRPFGFLFPGETVNYTCSPGHTGDGVPNGPKTIVYVCNSRGEVVPLGSSLSGCEPVNCGAAPYVKAGEALVEDIHGKISYGHSVDYKCAPGFTAGSPAVHDAHENDHFTATCGPDGHWQPSPFPTCTAVMCRTPLHVPNAKPSITAEAAVVRVGQRLEYTCDVGYTTTDETGQFSLPCETVWKADGDVRVEITSPKSALCERVVCHERPPSINNATLSSPLDNIDLLRFDDQLNYTCTDGNAVNGEAGRRRLTVRCDAAGDWDVPMDTCQPVQCGDVDDIPSRWTMNTGNLTTVGSTIIAGQTISLSCNTHSRIVGSSRSTVEVLCGEDGNFVNPTGGVCAADCPMPEIEGAHAVGVGRGDTSHVPYQSSLRFQCDEPIKSHFEVSLDYPVSVTAEPLTPDSSSVDLTCGQSGELRYRDTLLGNMELSCAKRRCTGPLPVIAHARAIDFNPTEGGRVDDRVEFVCDDKWAPGGDGGVTAVCVIDEGKTGEECVPSAPSFGVGVYKEGHEPPMEVAGGSQDCTWPEVPGATVEVGEDAQSATYTCKEANRYIYSRATVTVICDKFSDGSSRLSIPLPVVEGCTEVEKECWDDELGVKASPGQRVLVYCDDDEEDEEGPGDTHTASSTPFNATTTVSGRASSLGPTNTSTAGDAGPTEGSVSTEESAVSRVPIGTPPARTTVAHTTVSGSVTTRPPRGGGPHGSEVEQSGAGLSEAAEASFVQSMELESSRLLRGEARRGGGGLEPGESPDGNATRDEHGIRDGVWDTTIEEPVKRIPYKLIPYYRQKKALEGNNTEEAGSNHAGHDDASQPHTGHDDASQPHTGHDDASQPHTGPS